MCIPAALGSVSMASSGRPASWLDSDGRLLATSSEDRSSRRRLLLWTPVLLNLGPLS